MTDPHIREINDIVYLRHLPNMIVMAPKDENELRHMIHSALEYGHPTAIRFPKGRVYGVDLDKKLEVLPLGKAELLKPGKDLLLAFGNMVHDCLHAAERLEKEGISLAVANARFAQPLDRDLILSYAKSGGTVITAEEGVTAGGFGSAVRELLDSEGKENVRFFQTGLPVEIYPVGKVEQIKRMYGLDEDGLVKKLRNFYGRGDEAPETSSG